jgi:glutamyl-tRNA synthetase
MKGLPTSDTEQALLTKAMPGLKPRAKTLPELAEAAVFYIHPLPLPLDPKAAKALSEEGIKHLTDLQSVLNNLDSWEESKIDSALRAYADSKELKLGQVFQPLRAALAGTMNSPSVVEIAYNLGQDQVNKRIQSCHNKQEPDIKK